MYCKLFAFTLTYFTFFMPCILKIWKTRYFVDARMYANMFALIRQPSCLVSMATTETCNKKTLL